MKLRMMLTVAAVVLMAGCVSMPTPEEIAKLDYGDPITIDYEAAIKNHFKRILFDPYSAQYDFQSPRQHWLKEPPLFGGRLYAGYMVFVGVNAKNRMGGYVGMQDYGFIFKNDTIIRVLGPAEISMIKQQ